MTLFLSFCYVRTPEDVKVMIKHAKLEEKDIKPITQAIYFTNRTEEDYKLLEINPLVISALKEGQKVVFRGARDDKAVLCTEDKTFEVKEAETSNSLLLLPELKLAEDCKGDDEDVRQLEERKLFSIQVSKNQPSVNMNIPDSPLACWELHPQSPVQIVGVFHTYLELRLIKPRLRRLKSLLEPSSYRGSELEADLLESGVRLYTTVDLLREVQASEQELTGGLEDLGACCIDGKWRLLEFDYHFRVLSYFLNLIDSNSWNVSSIPYRETIDNLQDLMPMYILEHVFHQYCEMSGDRDDEGEPLYSLLEDKTCRFLAEVLLRPAGRFNLQDFLQAWQDSVPEGLQTDLKQLDGIALTDLNARPQVIWFFPETDLPEDIQERINVLFEIRDKWTLDQIHPYIEKLTTEKQNVNALLTKHARASNINGVRYYSSRHGK
ncbi:Sister chromatid cohesion protein DCC1 [Homalodisca vitripennis]|nr:Sister chromatid cohesion protein DCC1 [Homalodisca vitripennis]